MTALPPRPLSTVSITSAHISADVLPAIEKDPFLSKVVLGSYPHFIHILICETMIAISGFWILKKSVNP
jgi:hypothetical protein